MKIIFLLGLLFFYSQNLFGQELLIKGTVQDSNGYSIEGASIVCSYKSDFLGYTYTNQDGSYELNLNLMKNKDSLSIAVHSLGFSKNEKTIFIKGKTTVLQNFTMQSKVEELNTVVLKPEEKINIKKDTVSYKVSAFTNKTEQTVEDVLENIPGIEVDDQGNIKAFGKSIQKILIEGDDLADSNYKIISRNLNAKVLDKVEVISNYNDNPVLKQFLLSEATVLNLKLKEEAKTVWFGKVQIGAGNNDKYLADLNLGLIFPKIKFLVLGDFNRTGKPAKGLLENYTYEKEGFNDFGKTHDFKLAPLFNLNGQTIPIDDPFYIENSSFSNNILLNKTIWEKAKFRNSMFIYKDELNKSYFNRNTYFLPTGDISFAEDNDFNFRNINLTNDIELSYPIDENNFLSVKNKITVGSDGSKNQLLFNNDERLFQNLKNNTISSESHIKLTRKINKGALLIYGYFGGTWDKYLFESTPTSEITENPILSIASNNAINQGIEASAIYKFNRFSYVLSAGIENKIEKLRVTTEEEDREIDSLYNKNKADQFKIFLEIKGKYSLIPDKLFIEGKFKGIRDNYQSRLDSDQFYFFNPELELNLRKTSFGSFRIRYERNNELPSIIRFNQNYIFKSYRNLQSGLENVNILRHNLYSFSYILSKEKEQLLFSANISYRQQPNDILSNSIINTNQNLTRLVYAQGGDFLALRLGLTSYINPFDISLKVGYNKNDFENPYFLNNTFTRIKNNSDTYYLQGTTYWKGSLNFKFSSSYNKNIGIFENSENINEQFSFSLNTILRFNNLFFGNLKNEIFIINNQYYETNTANLEYRPENKKYVYGLNLQNIFNSQDYRFISTTNYQENDLRFSAVSRFIVGYVKLRF